MSSTKAKDFLIEKGFNGFANHSLVPRWMDEYAQHKAIAFLSWYAIKMIGFIEYLKDVKPQVTSNEIEEKLAEFEGKPISELYEIFSQTNQ